MPFLAVRKQGFAEGPRFSLSPGLVVVNSLNVLYFGFSEDM